MYALRTEILSLMQTDSVNLCPTTKNAVMCCICRRKTLTLTIVVVGIVIDSVRVLLLFSASRCLRWLKGGFIPPGCPDWCWGARYFWYGGPGGYDNECDMWDLPIPYVYVWKGSVRPGLYVADRCFKYETPAAKYIKCSENCELL